MTIFKPHTLANVKRARLAGFTLLELVIALAVVAILGAIAYPSYRQSVMKSRRADATTALQNLANRMEQYYASNNTFATATIGAAVPATDVLTSSASPQGFYTISITAQTATTFTIKATRTGVQTGDQCGDLTLMSTGTKGIVSNATGYTVAPCW